MISLRNTRTVWLLITMMVLAQPLVAVSATPPNNDKWYLMASNGNKKKYYGVSKYVAIFVNDKAVKGKILSINEDSITLKTRFKQIKTIAINDIDSVQNYNRSARVGWIPILSMLVLLTIGGLLTSGFVAAIFLAMPAVSLFTAIPIWLLSLITEPFSKKSAKKGWKFAASQKK